MKRLTLFQLGLLLCQLLTIAGCGWGDFDMDLSSMFDGWYYEGEPPDSFRVSSAYIYLETDSVLYSPGSVPEVWGYAEVRNDYSGPLRGMRLEFCVSDSNGSFRWNSPTLQDTTDASGRVGFTLICPECAGEVKVTDHYASQIVVFLPEDRRPAFLSAFASPETLYVDSLHQEPLTIGLTVMDGEHKPISGFVVESEQLNPDLPTCYRYRARTDSTGTVSTTTAYYWRIQTPYQHCYPLVVGGLTGLACAYFMPWDSTHGE